MPNSNRGAFGRGNGTITVIEEPVLRSYRRKAKIVFYVTWILVGLLAATVAASKWHPILALFAGLAFGLITGLAAGAIVSAWPVIRAIWWWAPETALFGGLITGWIELAGHTTLIYRLAAVAAIVGIPAAVKPVRTRLYEIVALVPDHPAPRPDLLFGIHHHQPHRQLAAHLVGHTHPRRGTRLDLAAPRPVPR